LICPKCGTSNPDYFVYCKKCSEELPAAPLEQEPAAGKETGRAAENPDSRRTQEPAYDDPYAYRAAQRRAAPPAQPADGDLQPPEGPYYDPRQRHHALDPWELLRDEPESEQQEQPKAVPASGREPEQRPYRRQEAGNGGEAWQYRRAEDRFSRQPAAVTHKPRQRTQEEPLESTGQRTVGAQQVRQESRGQIEREPALRSSLDEPARERRVVPGRLEPRKTDFSARSPLRTEEQPARPSQTERPVRNVGRLAPRQPGGAPADRFLAGERPEDSTRRFARPPLPDDQQKEEGFVPLSPEEERENERRRRKQERQEKREQARRQAHSDPSLPAENRQGPAAEDHDEATVHKSRVINIVFWVLIAVLAIATLFFTYRYLSERYGSIGGAFSAWFGGESEPSAAAGQPLVEETTYEDMAAHSITVYGEDGETAVFYDPSTGEELKRAVLQNGGYKLTIVDLNWIPEDPGEENTMEIKPRIVLIDAEGKENELDVPGFFVAVPQTELTVTSPDLSAAVTAEGNTLTITGTVQADTPTRLFWGEEEITACIDTATGSFTYEAALDGSTEYQLSAALSRHGRNTLTIHVEGASAPAELSLTLGELPSSTENDTQMISGISEPGATISVDGLISGSVKSDDSGSFSFVADLSSGYGVHTYTITAAIGERTASVACSILRTPEIDAYSRKAQIFEYRTVLRNPNDSKGKIYRIDGTVGSVEQAEEGHQIVLFYADGDRDQPVLLDYYSTSTLREGTEYRVFADANGNTEETENQPKMPRMNAWFAGRNN